jgi:hypothetical protein
LKKALLLLALLVPALAPLTYPGFIGTLATFLPVYRTSDWAWNPLGEGGFLAYLMASWLQKAGLTSAESVKATWALSLALGAFGVFFWLQRKGPEALLASALYVYSPFILAAIYVRGELGEPFFWGLLPWLFAALSYGGRQAFAYLAALGISILLVLANPGFAVFALIAGAVYALLNRRWLFPILAFFLGFTLYPFTRTFFPRPNPEFFAHFVLPHQIFSAWWGVRASSPGWIEEMPFQLGVIPLALSLLSLPGWAKARDKAGSFALALGLIPILLSLPLAYPLWKISSFWKLLRYPWEILGFAALGLAILGGMSLHYIPALKDWPLWAALSVLVLLGSYRYLEPNFVDYVPQPAPLAVIGSDNAILVDCWRSGEPKPGGKLEVELFWQALKPFDRDYSVFVHLLDSEGRKWAQRDQPPLNGEKPTSSWMPGELIRDRYILDLPSDLPSGPFSLAIGIYRWDTGERLKVRGREDGQALIPLGRCQEWKEGNGSGR